MKYPCNLIKDLLPLYIDNVCSEESKEIVEQHLAECPECKTYYQSMTESNAALTLPVEQERERQKAQSFLAVKKRLRIKQLLTAMISIVMLIAIVFSSVAILSNYDKVVTYDDNISVSMVNGSLVGRLIGSRQQQVNIKRVDVTVNGDELSYLFFRVYDTKWNELITNKDVFYEFILCPADKSADEIDCVFYYAGDYTGIETMSYAELQAIIDDSVLLWSK